MAVLSTSFQTLIGRLVARSSQNYGRSVNLISNSYRQTSGSFRYTDSFSHTWNFKLLQVDQWLGQKITSEPLNFYFKLLQVDQWLMLVRRNHAVGAIFQTLIGRLVAVIQGFGFLGFSINFKLLQVDQWHTKTRVLRNRGARFQTLIGRLVALGTPLRKSSYI